MKIRFAPIGAALSIVALLAWIGSSGRNDTSVVEVEGALAASVPVPSIEVSAPQEQTAGSAVPCVVPLGVHIARVDESFDLSVAEAMAALDQAATLWEDAVGRSLFSRSDGEIPVRLVYDERQERTLERNRLLRDFDEARARLEVERDELDERSQRQEQMQRQHQDALRDLERRVTALNDSIRYWNVRGGPPEEVLRRLRASGSALNAEREALSDRSEELAQLRRRLADDAERYDRTVEAHRREGEALQAAYPGGRLQSGAYQETVHTEDGRVTSVAREILIYRYDGLDNLVAVAAHELGHALGLGHSAVPGSLMSESFDQDEPGQAAASQGAPRVQPSDVEALRSLCSEL